MPTNTPPSQSSRGSGGVGLVKDPAARPSPLAGDASVEQLLDNMDSGGGTRTQDMSPTTDEDKPPGAFGALLAKMGEHWRIILPLAFVVAAGVLYMLGWFGGSSDTEAAATPGGRAVQAEQPSPQGSDTAVVANQAPGDVRDTGIVVEEPLIEDGYFYLRAGSITWKGEAKETENGEELKLEGTTVANFKQAVKLPGKDASGADNSITTGVFGRAEPAKPVLHATISRAIVGDQEINTGTYYALSGQTVLLMGDFYDERRGDKVIRTYTDKAPGDTQRTSYSVSFTAPPKTLVPALIGLEEPQLPESETEDPAKTDTRSQKEAA